MKTLQNITDGFKSYDTQKIEVSKSLKYYFTDYTDNNLPNISGKNWVGNISRYVWGFEMGVKWYDDKTKFNNAIKRIVKMQTL